MGKRKIAMEKGEKPMNIDVCFSKRRSGLFKKASELCILTGAQVAIIAFSPHGNPFLFGHPSPDSVIDHYYVNGTAGPVYGMNGSTAITTSEHARLAEEIETWKLLLKEQQQTKKEEVELLGTDYYKEWFKIDNQENMSLEELESLRDEWNLVREKIANKLGIMEEFSSSMAASSSCGGSSHFNNNGVNGSFYVGSSSSSSTFYDPLATGFAINNGSICHGDVTRYCNGVALKEEATNLTRHEVVNAGMGMDVSGDCLDVFESLPPLFEEDYQWDF